MQMLKEICKKSESSLYRPFMKTLLAKEQTRAQSRQWATMNVLVH